jgi:hypothetical protein
MGRVAQPIADGFSLTRGVHEADERTEDRRRQKRHDDQQSDECSQANGRASLPDLRVLNMPAADFRVVREPKVDRP